METTTEQPQASNLSSAPLPVRLVEIGDIPYWSLVNLMLKLTLASIPVALFLALVVGLLGVALGGLTAIGSLP